MIDTELYKEIKRMLYESGLSIRGFSTAKGIPHGWLIEFLNENKPFRPLQVKTKSMLNKSLGIPFDIMEDYNKKVLEMKKNVSL